MKLEHQRLSAHLLFSFSTHFLTTCYGELVSNTQKPTAKAEATTPNKGVRKVNLSELAGSLSKRGRERFHDDVLAQALTAMLSDGEPFIWMDAIVTGKTEKQVTASRAKWRSRAMSVFTALNAPENVGISIRWTDENEMVIIPKDLTV